MVISEEHKFVFIELPQTASSAIAKELVATYNCEEILFKHALYQTDFKKYASEEEKKYRAVSGLRNPMDICVSNYFKFKTDHQSRYTKPGFIKHGLLRRYIMRWWNVQQYKNIMGKEESFEDFFMRAYKIPYASWSILGHHKMDYIIRFENLQKDFSNALHYLNVEKKRELPVANKTAAKTKTFWEYYETDKAKKRAKYIFGPYMKQWGYDFPESWEKYKTPWYAFPIYRFFNGLRKIFWLYLR